VTYTSWSDSEIVCIVPEGAPAGSIAVTVQVDFGTVILSSEGFFVTVEATGDGGSSGGEDYTWITTF
jgi:hypothetical protein